jgi:hypothetical protein
MDRAGGFGSLAPVEPADERGEAMERGYIGRHWHGELTLPVAFWVNNFLLPVPVALAIGALAAWIALTGDFLRGGGIALLVAWPLLLLLTLWCIVGAWRSATAYRESGGSGLWSALAKLYLFLSVVGTLANVGVEFVPNAGDWLRMARGVDPIGNLQTSVSPDGRKLRLEGPIGLGDAARVRRLVGEAKGVRIVELDSPGGRLVEAVAIAEVVRGGSWNTRATGDCESACTLIHMAGSRRQLMPGARLGFHRASTGTLNPVWDNLANRELARVYREAGLPERMIERTLATPASLMWHPTRDELAGAGLLSLTERPLDVELPLAAAGAPATTTDYAEALNTSDTWLALEQRFPGTSMEAAERMQAAQAAGADAGRVQVEGQRVVEARFAELLASPYHEVRETYAALLADQLAAARAAGPVACTAVLEADAEVRRALPAALVQREAAWIVFAAGAPPREERARSGSGGFSTLELEVIRRRLGERAAPQLLGLWRGPGADRPAALACDRTIEWLRTVTALPVAERRLALRMIFERG